MQAFDIKTAPKTSPIKLNRHYRIHLNGGWVVCQRRGPSFLKLDRLEIDLDSSATAYFEIIEFQKQRIQFKIQIEIRI